MSLTVALALETTLFDGTVTGKSSWNLRQSPLELIWFQLGRRVLKSLQGVWATENEWHDEEEEYDFYMFVLETELSRELQPPASSTIFHQSRKSKN